MRLIVILLAVVMLPAASGYLTYENRRESQPIFTSSTEILLLPSEVELSYAKDVLGGSSSSQTTALMRTFTEKLKSDAVVADAIASVSEMGAIDSRADQAAFKEIRDAISVSDIDGSFIMQVSFSHSEPNVAAAFANALTQSYEATILLDQRNDLSAIKADLEASLTEIRAMYDTLLALEVEKRKEIGAVSLEFEKANLNEAVRNRLQQIQVHRQSVGALRLERSGSSVADLAAQNEKIAALEAQIAQEEAIVETIRASIGDAMRKEIQLRSVLQQQQEIQQASQQLAEFYYLAETKFGSQRSSVQVLRSAVIPAAPNPPTPLQAAIAVGTVVLILSSAAVAIPSATRRSKKETTKPVKSRNSETVSDFNEKGLTGQRDAIASTLKARRPTI